MKKNAAMKRNSSIATRANTTADTTTSKAGAKANARTGANVNTKRNAAKSKRRKNALKNGAGMNRICAHKRKNRNNTSKCNSNQNHRNNQWSSRLTQT